MLSGVMTRNTTDMSASEITIVPTKDNTIRVCLDYTFLNVHTRPISYPLPRIDALPEFIPEGTKYFSCLNLKEAYYSLPYYSLLQILENIQLLSPIMGYSSQNVPHSG